MRYTAIADVSRALTEMIRANTVPELIDKPDSIVSNWGYTFIT